MNLEYHRAGVCINSNWSTSKDIPGTLFIDYLIPWYWHLDNHASRCYGYDLAWRLCFGCSTFLPTTWDIWCTSRRDHTSWNGRCHLYQRLCTDRVRLLEQWELVTGRKVAKGIMSKSFLCLWTNLYSLLCSRWKGMYWCISMQFER